MYTKMLTPFLAPGGTMPGERVEPGEGVHEGRNLDRIIKPHKYVLSVLQSFTLSIPIQQGKARSHAKEQCKGAKGEQSSKGQRVNECKGVKDRLKIYYN